jgi:hypothetical protein
MYKYFKVKPFFYGRSYLNKQDEGWFKSFFSDVESTFTVWFIIGCQNCIISNFSTKKLPFFAHYNVQQLILYHIPTHSNIFLYYVLESDTI